MVRSVGGGIVLAVLAGLGAQAQDSGPLQTRIDDSIAAFAVVENLGDLVHCTGLFRALALLAGPETDLGSASAERERYAASVAGLVWMSAAVAEPRTPDEAFDVLGPAMAEIFAAYVAHMGALIEGGETPFDAAVIDQAAFCNALHDALSAAAP